MTNKSIVKRYEYFRYGYRAVRIGYNQNGDPCVAEVANPETKRMEIDNSYIPIILLEDADDLQELDEPTFAEFCLQKGVKSR